MIDFDGSSIDPSEVLDVTSHKEDTTTFLSTGSFPKRPRKKLIEIQDEDIDHYIRGNPANLGKYEYYEFIEETVKPEDLKQEEVVIVDENQLNNDEISSDSYDPDDSNDENNPNNSYPDTPEDSDEWNSDSEEEYYNDHYDDDSSYDSGNLDYSKDEDGSYDNRMDIDYGEDDKSIHLDSDDDSDDVYIPKKHKKMEDD